MAKSLTLLVVLAALVCAFALASGRRGQALTPSAAMVPDPRIDEPTAARSASETTVVAGGCFWGVQAVFEQVRGVRSATSGYAGGSQPADYETVSTGRTGHAESVKIVYDPATITYGMLLKIFFSVVHDPTQVNQQGPDVGTQYRSAIFYTNADQEKIAKAYIAQLEAAKVFSRRIATEVTPLRKFYEAEAYHQDYYFQHPAQPYIVFYDKPKVAALKQQFPRLFVEHR
ncbi:MAG TPA: peptide-methionine (S)-S-oxide reductase MsrA [Vicinamibacterales bacterium]|nr:peptide-methionine (S)-S-oxide reductase MsrA [Vicinamibacterales bacterium]